MGSVGLSWVQGRVVFGLEGQGGSYFGVGVVLYTLKNYEIYFNNFEFKAML